VPLWIAVAVLGAGFVWLALDRPSQLATQDPTLPALERRIDALETRPAPGPAADPRIAPLEARLTALENRPAPAGDGAALAALQARVVALETRPGPAAPAAPPAAAPAALTALEARLAALEARPAPPPPPAPEDAQARAAVAALQGRITALEARPVAPDQSAAIAAVAARLAAVAGVSAALEQGRPLGAALAQLPTGTAVPPPLAAFADAPAPTMASLRLSFPEAARAARDAADAEGEGMWNRATARLSTLLTVRKGDEVLIGHPVAGTLMAVERALNAGDLAGAVSASAALTGGAATAFAPWRARAEALIAAHDALATLARAR
jgi:BMFP domain-containing protein YqiC